MYQINCLELEDNIKKAQGVFEDPIKKHITLALKSNCTIAVKTASGEEWSGSGFHIGAGLVTTVAHVAKLELLKEHYELKLTFDGTHYYNGKIIISNPTDDTAMIMCEEAKRMPSIALGDSDEIEVGDIIAVISSPEGWHDTATVGRVSNVKQNLGEFAPSPAWNDMIFIDADILVGSSGGMMLATDGKVYGIVMGITGQNAEVGVGQHAVIPVNKFKKIISLLEFNKEDYV
jgi:serine protease Do